MHKYLTASLLIAMSGEALAEMNLTSKNFKDDGLMPKEMSCESQTPSSPELSWTGVPEGTKSLALLTLDSEAFRPPFGLIDHWVVFNLPADSKGLPQGVKEFPKGTVLGQNFRKENGFLPACPPMGNHHYIFTLYALNTFLDLPEGASREQVLGAMQGHIIETATITGRYKKEKGDPMAGLKKPH